MDKAKPNSWEWTAFVILIMLALMLFTLSAKRSDILSRHASRLHMEELRVIKDTRIMCQHYAEYRKTSARIPSLEDHCITYTGTQ